MYRSFFCVLQDAPSVLDAAGIAWLKLRVTPWLQVKSLGETASVDEVFVNDTLGLPSARYPQLRVLTYHLVCNFDTCVTPFVRHQSTRISPLQYALSNFLKLHLLSTFHLSSPTYSSSFLSGMAAFSRYFVYTIIYHVLLTFCFHSHTAMSPSIARRLLPHDDRSVGAPNTRVASHT